MQGDRKVIQHLNTVLANQLIAINQYFIHARIYKNWGIEELNTKEYHFSIEEMKRSDKVIQRILFLEGLPNVQDLGKLLIGEHTEEMLNADYNLELKAVDDLNEAISYCEDNQDYVSRELLEKLLNKQEDHIDWLESQFYLIKETGIENYIQSMIDDKH
ncbi:MAG: bacterioferritin [Pseudomonadota bacterium]